ncbi:hypothetical protein BC940DRAFT_122962 [Gongronella butleri]|nr:hypothetical protein BC940DRAFT_122962 [Gongronella butleri]
MLYASREIQEQQHLLSCSGTSGWPGSTCLHDTAKEEQVPSSSACSSPLSSSFTAVGLPAMHGLLLFIRYFPDVLRFFRHRDIHFVKSCWLNLQRASLACKDPAWRQQALNWLASTADRLKAKIAAYPDTQNAANRMEMLANDEENASTYHLICALRCMLHRIDIITHVVKSIHYGILLGQTPRSIALQVRASIIKVLQSSPPALAFNVDNSDRNVAEHDQQPAQQEQWYPYHGNTMDTNPQDMYLPTQQDGIYKPLMTWSTSCTGYSGSMDRASVPLTAHDATFSSDASLTVMAPPPMAHAYADNGFHPGFRELPIYDTQLVRLADLSMSSATASQSSTTPSPAFSGSYGSMEHGYSLVAPLQMPSSYYPTQVPPQHVVHAPCVSMGAVETRNGVKIQEIHDCAWPPLDYRAPDSPPDAYRQPMRTMDAPQQVQEHQDRSPTPNESQSTPAQLETHPSPTNLLDASMSSPSSTLSSWASAELVHQRKKKAGDSDDDYQFDGDDLEDDDDDYLDGLDDDDDDDEDIFKLETVTVPNDQSGDDTPQPVKTRKRAKMIKKGSTLTTPTVPSPPPPSPKTPKAPKTTNTTKNKTKTKVGKAPVRPGRTATSYDAATTHYLLKNFFEKYSQRDKLAKEERRQIVRHTGLKPRNITYWFSNHKRRFRRALQLFKQLAKKGEIKTYEDFLSWRRVQGMNDDLASA